MEKSKPLCLFYFKVTFGILDNVQVFFCLQQCAFVLEKYIT